MGEVFFKHGNDPDENFDPEQLKLGIEVEIEHTDDLEIAKQIAKAHLAEIPNYYILLKEMEKQAKVNKEIGMNKKELVASLEKIGVEVRSGKIKKSELEKVVELVEAALDGDIDDEDFEAKATAGYSLLQCINNQQRDDDAPMLEQQDLESLIKEAKKLADMLAEWTDDYEIMFRGNDLLDAHNVTADTFFTDIKGAEPGSKDLRRMEDMKFKAAGDKERLEKLSLQMAGAILDKDKAIRRAKAAEKVFKGETGKKIAKIFTNRAKEL